MICPKCKTDIDAVYVISECSQTGTLSGNRVDDYAELEVGKTIRIECSECGKDIIKHVESD